MVAVAVEGLPMADGRIKLGDRVKIRVASGSADLRGRVVELRGPLGPKGAQIYRVRLRRKPKPAYIEVREDQLEPIAAGG